MRTENTPTRDDVARLMAAMNAEQLALWYDIGKRIQNAPIANFPTFLQATPEELAAEDAEWGAVLRSDPEALTRLASDALRAHKEGRTTGIDDNGSELQPSPAHAITS